MPTKSEKAWLRQRDFYIRQNRFSCMHCPYHEVLGGYIRCYNWDSEGFTICVNDEPYLSKAEFEGEVAFYHRLATLLAKQLPDDVVLTAYQKAEEGGILLGDCHEIAGLA